MKYYAGIDVGGTKIYSVVIDEQAKILSRSKMKTKKEEGFDSVVSRIELCYAEAVEKSGVNEQDIVAIGMGVPSPVNVKDGILIFAPNLGWKNVEFSRIMFEKLKKPIFIDNDVNMGTFGEMMSLKDNPYNSIYGIFMGTGVGGGYILDGNIVRGTNYTAGEVGHMTIDYTGDRCTCGRKGCLETIAGKVGIINNIKKHLNHTKDKTILDKISPNWRKGVGSSALRKAYEKKDKFVVKALDTAAKAIGIAMGSLVNAVGVQAFIIGGGIIEEMGNLLLPIIKKNMEKYSIGNGANGVDVIKSSLDDDAVAFGGAKFVSMDEKAEYLYPKQK